MINGLEGIPGSGKSYEAVTFHVLHALKAGRKVITNLPLQKVKFAEMDENYFGLIEVRHKPSPVQGTWDVDRVDDKGNGLAFQLYDDKISGSTMDEKPSSDNGVFGSVWDFFTDWKHPVTGQGPLYVIDECHICFPKIGINPEVVEWFKLHRHYNCDVLLATQNFRDVNQPIANLLAMMVKVRNADILTGKRDSYIRKVHAGYRGAQISSEIRKYDPAFFPLYKSHSQGNSVAEASASDVQPFLVKFQKFTRYFLIVTFFAVCYAIYRWMNPPVVPVINKVAATVMNAAPSQVTNALPPVLAAPPPDPQKMVNMAQDETPEPYAAKGLHLTGRLAFGQRVLYTFAVSAGSTRLGQVTSDDLKSIGYTWQPLTDCAGTLRWKQTAKTVTCDAPAMPEGSSNAPVVITVPAGSSTPTARSDGQPIPAKNTTPARVAA